MAMLGARRTVMGCWFRSAHWFWGRKDAQGRAGHGGVTMYQAGQGGCSHGNGRNSMGHRSQLSIEDYSVMRIRGEFLDLEQGSI